MVLLDFVSLSLWQAVLLVAVVVAAFISAIVLILAIAVCSYVFRYVVMKLFGCMRRACLVPGGGCCRCCL